MQMSEKRVHVELIDEMTRELHFEYYHVPNSTVTACWAFLPNGYKIGYGESACVDPHNFNEELGRMYAEANARKDAVAKLWENEGYLLMMTGRTSEAF